MTVRFETPGSGPGRVKTFRVDDAALEPADPLPLVSLPPGADQPAEACGPPDMRTS